MKFYTIQSFEKWVDFEKTGLLTADVEYIKNYYSDWPNLIESYDWLVSKMNLMLPNPLNLRYPIWCWKASKYKPDLRKKWSEKGKRVTLITFEANLEDVILTDFTNWHQVLNFGFLPSNEQEEYEYCELDRKYSDEEIIKSWDNLFTMKDNVRNEQGTLWSIKMEQVLSVKHYICS